jgi:cephalosporin-C deacetylase
VPPPGQFAVANSLGGPHEIFVLAAGHAEHPDLPAQRKEFNQKLEEFLWAQAPPWNQPQPTDV